MTKLLQLFERLTILITLCMFVYTYGQKHHGNKEYHHNITNSQARRYFKSGFIRTNPHSVETMLLYREYEIYEQTIIEAKKKGYSIQGFYHTSTWQPKWSTVILEQLKLIDGQRRIAKNPNLDTTTYEWNNNNTWANLLKYSNNLYVNVAGPTIEDRNKIENLIKTSNIKYKEKISINYNKTVSREEYNSGNEEKRKNLMNNKELSAGEHSTIDSLHNYCVDKVNKGEKALVYYLHSKYTVLYRKMLYVLYLYYCYICPIFIW